MKVKDTLEKSIRAVKYILYKDLSISDQIRVSDVLDDDVTLLFWRMRLEDRSHSLEVMKRMESITNENRFLTLALIHDIGKLQSDIGWLGRIFADLGLNKTFTAERYKNHESYGYMIIKNHIGSNNIINDYKMSILDDRHKYLNRCDY
tara:strand:+ start:169 stop:612 length:444 start_codon:yes stop_codon:yes gene_type:complete